MLARGNGTDATRANGLVKDTTTQTFAKDVIEESRRQPVLVDFWAPWCGPCRQLTPILEKVVAAAKGKVKLVKMNIDEHPAIAGQLGIQSIPAVIAFSKGQPIDGFLGALPESQVKAFVDRLGGSALPSGVEELLNAGEKMLAEGDPDGAADAFAAVLDEDEGNVKAIGGLARAFAAAGDLSRAKEMLARAPAEKANDAALAGARAQIELAEQAAAVGDLAELIRKVEANPSDHAARYDLAVGLNARGEREKALDHLIEIVRRDRSWNDDAARKQLVQLFQAWGPTDPVTIAGRRRLSSLLFA